MAVIINGTNGPDVLHGFDGTDDVINGLGGDDTLSGRAGDDTLNGGDGNDNLDGGDGYNTLLGGAGDDVLTRSGFDGSFFEGGAGADTITGGLDSTPGQRVDTASYAGSSAGVTVNLNDLGNAQGHGGDAEGDVLSNIENLVGSAHDDVLSGGFRQSNIPSDLSGGAGNDVLTVGKNGGVLEGGAGADTLICNAALNSSDQAIASYEHSSSGVIVNLATGTGTGGDAEGDVLHGMTGVRGSAFDDVLTGGVGNDVLSGGDGNDLIIASAGADKLDGGLGDFDTVDYSHAAARIVVNLATGTGGGAAQGTTYTSIEGIVGTAFNDSLTGDGRANLFEGGAGADALNGGDGSDTAIYAHSTAGITISLITGVALGGDAQGDVLTSIENLVGSAFADTLVGNSGNNTLEGGAGADILNGSIGADTASYEHSSAAVHVDLGAGIASGGDAQGDSLNSIENLIGSDFNDTLVGFGSNLLVGGAGDDTLSNAANLDGGDGNDILTNGGNLDGGAGDDVLTGAGNLDGGAGNDVLRGSGHMTGGAGDDILTGGSDVNGGDGDDIIQGTSGADTIDGGAGFDRVLYAHAAQGVTINLLLGTGLGGEAQDDVLTGIEGIQGSSHDDILIGDASDNIFYASNGNDVLSGGDGADILLGGAGADQLDGGAGVDTAYYSGSAAGVQVDLGAHTASGGDAAGDTLTNIEQLLGSDFADTLTGDAGANQLWGQAGDDVLTGGAGRDLLRGGAGNDRFVYLSASDSPNGDVHTVQDAILDFQTGDRIDLSAIDANGAGPGNGSFTFITGAFTGAGGEVHAEAGPDGFLEVSGDIDGDKVADFAFLVLSDHTLTAADFVL